MDHKPAAAQIFEIVLSSIPDFAYIFDRDGRFIYANQALLDLWGLQLEDAVGRNFFDLQYPDDLAVKLQQQIQQVIETKQGLTGETPYTSPSGAGGYYEYIFHPVLDPDGAVSMVAGSTRDISERKLAEENLRRTQARLGSALKAGLAGTFYWNITENRVITDENMMRYFSLSEEALNEGVRPANLLSAVHDLDRSKVEQAVTEAVETTGSYSTECRVRHSDGKIRWLSARGEIERDDAGIAIGLPGFTVDITERKRAEDALRESEERLRAIFESSRDGILVEDDERIVYINKSYTHLLGYDSPAELIGEHVSAVISPDDANRMLEFGRSRAGGELPPSVYEFKGKRKEGKLVDVEASVSTSTVAGRRYITTMVRDIADRKQAERALCESEERFRAAFEQANVGIVQASFDGILLKVNPGFCKIVGYSEDEVRGLPIREITHPEDYEEEEELTRQLLAGEIGGYSIEKRYLRKDGGIVWGQMTATFVRKESGEPFYMLAIIEDITERKRAEAELNKINEQLEGRVAERTVELLETNANLQAEIIERRKAERERASIMRRLVMAQEEERGRIARDMHDQFGQQLTALLLKFGMLKEGCGDQKELCSQVEILEAVAKQLDADVDFLVWELRPAALDDLGLGAALASYTENWSKHFGIPVEFLESGTAEHRLKPEIETALYRIAQEALNNTAKHAAAANITVLLEQRADEVSLIIEDDGSGFDARNAVENRKGFGLTGVMERAALVGGKVDIESQPGKGTSVNVRIPAPQLDVNGEPRE